MSELKSLIVANEKAKELTKANRLHKYITRLDKNIILLSKKSNSKQSICVQEASSNYFSFNMTVSNSLVINLLKQERQTTLESLNSLGYSI